MSANRKPESHFTGDAKMKAAAIKSAATVTAVTEDAAPQPVPSPAKQMQDQLAAHYQPLSKRMSVVLISVLVAFAFVGGWMSGTGSGGLI